MKNAQNIGSALFSIRQERGYSQVEFARILGISRSYLSEIETGVKNPSLQLLESIGDKLGIPLAVIYLKALSADDIPYPNKEEILTAIRPHIEKIESYFSLKESLAEIS